MIRRQETGAPVQRAVPGARRASGGLVLRASCLMVGPGLALLVAVRVQLAILRHPAAATGAAGDWLGIVVGLTAGGVILFLSLALALRPTSPRRAAWLLLGLSLLSLVAGLTATTHFPRANFKSDAVQAEWRLLHPTLRQALWVARLGDDSLVLTDLRRTPEDYRAMGLSLPWASRHFPQDDGYAHAVDLRVRDAGDLRNWARQGLFLLMGLRADRHDGTAEHLHISLPLAPAPG